jgi:hypothetical protein
MIKGYTIKVMIVKAIIFCLFMATASFSQAATAPVYDRLQPVTANINSPTAVALDKYESIYIAESVNNRIQIYSQSGQYGDTIPGLARPISVAVDDSGRTFIGNKDSGNVEVYDGEYNFLFKLGDGDGEFSQPNDIAIVGSETIYVVDKGEDNVKIYSASADSASLSSSFGGSGSGNGKFNSPSSIAIDEGAGELIVLDRQLSIDPFGKQIEGARIQVFDMNGGFKRSFSPYGNAVGQLFRPQHVAVDNQGRIYVTDSFHNVVIAYDSNGTYLGDVYDVNNPMRTPLGITAGGSNRLYIASLLTGKVEVYGIDLYTYMEVDPLSMSFQGDADSGPPAQTATITNNGTGALSWTASTNTDWINLSETSGTAQPAGTSQLDVGVDLTGLESGIYTGSVSISSVTGAAEVISVTLEVLSSQSMSVTPSSLIFTSTNGSNPSAQTLSIANAGGGALDWTASKDSSWILIDKTAGTSPDSLVVNVDITSLNAGTHTGAVTVTGEGLSPAVIPVTLNIVEITGTINVTSNIAEATFTISGPQSYNGSGVSWSETAAQTGTYSIVYGTVNGYTTPPSENQTLQADGTINFNGEYVSQGGGQQGVDKDDVFIDFGSSSGLWVYYDDSAWNQLHSVSPEIMANGDIDGNGDDDLVVDFGATYGIWVRYNDGSWAKLHGASPEIMTVADIDGDGNSDLIVDFGADGIWVRYNDGSWAKLHDASPEIMTVADIDEDGNSDLIVDFGADAGIWVRYNDGSWAKLHIASPEIMTVGDIDGNGDGDLIIDFGADYGIWVRYDSGSWANLHGASPEIMTVGDIDGSGDGDLIIDFGADYGIWIRQGDGTWKNIHKVSPEDMVAGEVGIQ